MTRERGSNAARMPPPRNGLAPEDRVDVLRVHPQGAVFTRDLVTDLPRWALDDLIGAAGGRPNQRQPLRLERHDRGIDPWVDRIVATRIDAGPGRGHETQPQAARQKRGTNNETMHTCSPSLG